MNCLRPYLVYGTTPVPCGKCSPCLKKRANAWAFRLTEHYRSNGNGSFITLTYSEDGCPMSPKGFMTLVKRDHQLFMKSFREFHPEGTKISFYMCGEYGSKRWRPHFHYIMFGADVNLIPKAWTLGEFHVGLVSPASIAYVTKYIHKPKRVPAHANDDRLPEFACMSKGIGLSYMERVNLIDWHRTDLSRKYHVTEGGFKIAMPRYYSERIFDESMRLDQRDLVRADSMIRYHEAVMRNSRGRSKLSLADTIEQARSYDDYRFYRISSRGSLD